ncbi:hypothetical protein ACET3Z_004462 [Daucus carota]
MPAPKRSSHVSHLFSLAAAAAASRASQVLTISSSENEEYPDLVHLPAATESSVNLLFEQFIKEMSRPKEEQRCSTHLKDWAHGEHPLQLVTVDELHDEKDLLLICNGCAKPIRNDGHVFYACVPCKYFLHKFCGCIMKPSRVEHRWDPHPLRLIFDPGMVEDHEHEFQCEYCSQDLDTNLWFYHCDDCDLSFHLRCYDESCHLRFSHVKYGATDIIKDHLHPHSLTFVLNKKSRRCGKCHDSHDSGPVLECAPCKTIFCAYCSGMPN